jgi:signal transduction histidine kinase
MPRQEFLGLRGLNDPRARIPEPADAPDDRYSHGVTEALERRRSYLLEGLAEVRDSWWEFWRTPAIMRAYLLGVFIAALVAPILMRDHTMPPVADNWLTAGVLIVVSVVNVEIGRALIGGLEFDHQPHKALSAWAFACALLLASPWLLMVVPVTYLHARWRGVRLPLWKWIGSGCYLVLAGTAAGVVARACLGADTDWMDGDGVLGLVAVLAAAATFLAAETILFCGSVAFNRPEDEVWLRETLGSTSFYGTEAGVLFMGALLAAVWTSLPWFVLLFAPVYALAQRAALHEPLRQRAETATLLAAQNEELDVANEFKIDLLGMLGHEVGTPLTAILGHAELGCDALDANDLERGRKSFQVIERGGTQIQGVVKDILAMVSSERGALSAHPQVCPLEPHLVAAASAGTRREPPRVECPPGLQAVVQPSHLDQILTNLLSNADKYAGGATLLRARAAPGGMVEVAVVDSGPGVPVALRPHLFERFSRDSATAQQVMGTGLGLFITRELARANGGDISLHEGSPGGSVFLVCLPASRP